MVYDNNQNKNTEKKKERKKNQEENNVFVFDDMKNIHAQRQ